MSYQIGQKEEVVRKFSHQDIVAYRRLAANDLSNEPSTEERLLVPNSLLGAIFSYLLGTKLPGLGAIYLKQSFNFLKDVYQDQEITGTVEIIAVKPEKGIITFRTTCVVDGELVCEGEALIMKK
ncbi:MAG: hypothetical protein JNN15_09295 [Blastocatellia bacterium]|nr:hypothetical protein [Blastocatellia bacterium]